MNILSKSEKYYEWVVTVNNPKDESNCQVGKLEKYLVDTGASFHVIGISDVLQNQKYGSSKNLIVGDRRKSSVTISGEL